MTCLRQLINVSDCPGNCTLFFRGIEGWGGWRDLKSSTLQYKSFSVDCRYRQFLNQYFIFLFEKKSTNSCTVTLEHVVSNPFYVRFYVVFKLSGTVVFPRGPRVRTTAAWVPRIPTWTSQRWRTNSWLFMTSFSTFHRRITLTV